MSKQFAAFDIDGTLFRSGLYREVVKELVSIGALNEQTTKAYSDQEALWQKRMHSNAFNEFEQAMAIALDDNLSRLRIADFEQAVSSVLRQQKDNVYVYTRELVKRLKSRGHTLIAITGSQIEIAKPFADYYGFDVCVGQVYERGDEYFTGTVLQKTHTGKEKFLERVIKDHELTLKNSYAVGDSKGDAGMLGMVEHPIVFNPEKELYEQAQKHGWKIVLERKNMIYEMEADSSGYVLAQTNAV